MSNQLPHSGWVRLSGGYDVEFRYGIPCRISDNGGAADVSDRELINEIRDVAGLDVQIDDWISGEVKNEKEAVLVVSPDQLGELLRRLALAAAALFVDRFGKAIDQSDIDWDTQEYAEDFQLALRLCGLEPGQVNRDDYLAGYVDAMHDETERLITTNEAPAVRAE